VKEKLGTTNKNRPIESVAPSEHKIQQKQLNTERLLTKTSNPKPRSHIEQILGEILQTNVECQNSPKTTEKTRKNDKFIKISHVNARSLTSDNKLGQLRHKITEENIDVLCITETWLHKDIPSNLLSIPNYELYRLDPHGQHRQGKGVCIYARTEFVIKPLDLSDQLSKHDSGVYCLNIQLQYKYNKSFIVSVIYRPPSSKVISFQHIEEILKTLLLRNKPIYCLGDFNNNILDDAQNKKHMNKIIKRLHLTQLIQQPTRKKSLLDLIITNNEKAIVSVIQQPGIADHEQVSCTIDLKIKKPAQEMITFRSKANYCPEVFQSEIATHDHQLRQLVKTDNVNKQFTTIANTLRNALDVCAPVITILPKRPPVKWITSEIKNKQISRDAIYRRYKLTDRQDALHEKLHSELANIQDELKKLTKKARAECTKQEISANKHDSKKLWKTLKRIVPNKGNPSKLCFEKPASTANQFNAHFASVGACAFQEATKNLAGDQSHLKTNGLSCNVPVTAPDRTDLKHDTVMNPLAPDISNSKTSPILTGTISHHLPPQAIATTTTTTTTTATVNSESTRNQISNTLVSSSHPIHDSKNCLWRPRPLMAYEIDIAIYSMKNTDATGDDGIALQYIKDSLPAMRFYLTTMINTSINTGVFPTAGKHALVVPIHKKGDKNDPSNYRPISLLPVLSKILEKVVADQLQKHLETSKKLTKQQFAYRRHRSTEHALLDIMEKVYHAIDNKCVALLVLLDLSKAFDSVCHAILLEKLQELGIDKFWFEDYLRNRTQSVKILDTVSAKQELEYGVPQGSILGPILFSIYVNDLPSCITTTGHVTMYADDTQLLYTGSPQSIDTIRTLAETDLRTLQHWYSANGLKVNAGKTQAIIMGSTSNTKTIPETFSIEFDGNTIQVADKVKSLGVWIDKHLTFDHHVETIRSKMYGTLLYINKRKHLFDTESRKLLIHSLVLSHVYNCNLIWGKCSNTSLWKVQTCMNFAAKVASDGHHKKRDHVSPLYANLRWLKLENIIKLNTALFMHSALHNPAHPSNLEFVLRRNCTNINTRGSNLFDIPRCRTKTGKRAMSISGPTIWNTLPKKIKSINSHSAIKSKLTDHYISEQLSQSTAQTKASMSVYPQCILKTKIFTKNFQSELIANSRVSSRATPFSSTANVSIKNFKLSPHAIPFFSSTGNSSQALSLSASQHTQQPSRYSQCSATSSSQAPSLSRSVLSPFASPFSPASR